MRKSKTIVCAFLLGLLLPLSVFGATVNYSYDDLNRLTRAEYDDGTVIEYAYDAAGNRTSHKVALPSGSLTVSLSPQGAVDAGAQWKVDSSGWQNNCATVSGLSVGSHTVSFKDVSGWTSPASQNVSVAAGKTTSAGGTYVLQTGSLKVSLIPAAAVTAGAQWRVDGGAWNQSGAVISALKTGSHQVSFKGITGWTAPAARSVTVEKDATKILTATYVQQTGSLTETLGPAGAVAAGACWRVDGGVWNQSGTSVSGLKVGNHTVSFKGVTGWTSPAARSVTVEKGETETLTASYVQQKGSLKVTLTPKAAVSAGAKWKVDDLPWKNSGDTVTGLGVGSHNVQFKKITGWKAPAGVTVTIKQGSTTTANGAYVKSAASLEEEPGE